MEQKYIRQRGDVSEKAKLGWFDLTCTDWFFPATPPKQNERGVPANSTVRPFNVTIP